MARGITTWPLLDILVNVIENGSHVRHR